MEGAGIAGAAVKAGSSLKDAETVVAAVRASTESGVKTVAGAAANRAGEVDKFVYGGFSDHATLSRGFLGAAGSEGLFWGGAGFAYGGLLRPSNETNVGTTKFWGDRLVNGLGDGAVFGVMGFTSPYIGRGSESLALRTQQIGSGIGQRCLEGALKAPVSQA